MDGEEYVRTRRKEELSTALLPQTLEGHCSHSFSFSFFISDQIICIQKPLITAMGSRSRIPKRFRKKRLKTINILLCCLTHAETWVN